MASILFLLPWIFAFVMYMLLVTASTFEIISLSDLENDFINPRELGKRVNWLQLPQMVIHAAITLSFLVFWRWIFLLINIPLLVYNIREFRRGQYLIDETEIFKQMKALQRLRIIKISFYITLVLLLMIRLILAAFE